MGDRSEIANHFHRLSQITRTQIFGERDQRPKHLPADAATMFAGYVGKRFNAETGLLVFGINPGGGRDAYQHRTPEDEIFVPLLTAFKHASPSEIESAFEQINEAFVPIVQGWNLWRILEPTLIAAGKQLDEIAYMNIVPYRTRNDVEPPAHAKEEAWSLVIRPTLQVLRPAALIALGRKAGKTLDARQQKHHCVPRTIGDRCISEQAKIVHKQIEQERRTTDSIRSVNKYFDTSVLAFVDAQHHPVFSQFLTPSMHQIRSRSFWGGDVHMNMDFQTISDEVASKAVIALLSRFREIGVDLTCIRSYSVHRDFFGVGSNYPLVEPKRLYDFLCGAWSQIGNATKRATAAYPALNAPDAIPQLLAIMSVIIAEALSFREANATL